MPEFNPPTIGQLKKAVEIAEKVSKLEAELAALLGLKAPAKGKALSVADFVEETTAPVAKQKKAKTRKKRVLSPEAREKIAAAQRARWAKSKN